MGNVLRIFINDLLAISKQFFAFVIAIAMLIIPALYAWFNIFSNWDPYGGTGNISIALVSRDQGYTLSTGEYRNEGRELTEEMAESTSINWVLTDYNEAMDGLKAGKYYAALVLGENLSRNMYNMTEALYDRSPSITYYQNAKTNAIANKITETAASTAEHNIQVHYLSILIENIFGKLDGVVEGIDTEKGVNELIRIMDTLDKKLDEYEEVIKKLQVTNINLGRTLHDGGDSISQTDLSGKISNLEAAKGNIEYIKVDTLQNVWDIQATLAEQQEDVSGFFAPDYSMVYTGNVNEAIEKNRELLAKINLMIASLANVSDVDLIAAKSDLETLRLRVQKTQTAMENIRDDGNLSPEERETLQNALLNMIGTTRNFVGEDVEKSMTRIFDNLIEDLEVLALVLESVQGSIQQIPPVMYAADGTLYAVNGTLEQVEKLMGDLHGAISDMVESLRNVQDNDTIESLIEMLNGDPEEFAAFLSSPVEVETTTIYPVNSYGTAMTPFYSTLALWVGCVVLSAIIKVEADGKGLRRKPSHAELYWGRFLTFFFFGQIQSIIIVWGDLHILGVECLHPGLMYFAAGVASFVFVCLIYSLTLTFGDVGKAITVVIMIVQIAGSSGSYPIEILPEIFSKIFLFFPFPYAINAMREAICGLYQYDYLKYLGQLLIFGAIGLFIGLVLRGPFHGVNEFVEEEMHESGVL